MKLDTSTDPQVGYRPPGELDVSTALQRYAGPFERRQAAHLLRRAGFGGTGDEISALAQTGAQRAVDVLVHPSGADEFADLPPLSDLYAFKQPGVQDQSAQLWWLNRMLLARYPLVEKVAPFEDCGVRAARRLSEGRVCGAARGGRAHHRIAPRNARYFRSARVVRHPCRSARATGPSPWHSRLRLIRILSRPCGARQRRPCARDDLFRIRPARAECFERTDHGTAMPLFVAGGKVKGGIYSDHPSLSDLDDGDLKFHTDFRSVYATALTRWLGRDPATVLGG